VNLALFVRERLDSYRELGLVRGLDIAVDIENELPTVLANPILLDQVVQNLLKNACDAMGGGGRVRLELRGTANGAELDVLDEGPGLPVGVIDRVFDPFFTTKPPGRGTGLGLSICYGIMSELRGKITCGNRPEGGAWFRIFLPHDEAGMERQRQRTATS